MTTTLRKEAMTIGALAKAAGCKPETIRYYEQIGLLDAPSRTEGGQRRYANATLQRMLFIRHARDFGFSIEAVRELLQMSDHPTLGCAEVDALATRHLEEVERRITRLTALRDELRRTLTQCAGGKVENCRVIEALSDHRLCEHHLDYRNDARNPAV